LEEAGARKNGGEKKVPAWTACMQADYHHANVRLKMEKPRFGGRKEGGAIPGVKASPRRPDPPRNGSEGLKKGQGANRKEVNNAIPASASGRQERKKPPQPHEKGAGKVPTTAVGGGNPYRTARGPTRVGKKENFTRCCSRKLRRP